MPPRILYCRYAGCGFSTLSHKGFIPTHCEKCGREARWTTIPAVGPGDYPDPEKPYTLSEADAAFLRTNRIDPEMIEDDGA